MSGYSPHSGPPHAGGAITTCHFCHDLADDIVRRALELSYVSWGGENVDPATLTPAEREKALDVAENTMWPVWES